MECVSHKQLAAAARRYRQEVLVSQVCYRTVLCRAHERGFDLDSVKGTLSTGLTLRRKFLCTIEICRCYCIVVLCSAFVWGSALNNEKVAHFAQPWADSTQQEIIVSRTHKTQLPYSESSTSNGLWEFLCCRSDVVVSVLVGYGA